MGQCDLFVAAKTYETATHILFSEASFKNHQLTLGNDYLLHLSKSSTLHCTPL